MKSIYARDGERLLHSNSTVRSWWQGKVIDDSEMKDGALIQACIKRIQHEGGNRDYIKAVRVIGDVLGHAEEALSDSWIEYRIRALIHAGKLAYEGNLQSMRMYKIREVQ